MALAATMVVEVRATGNAANAGAFNPVAGAGVDRSQQDAAYIAYTDLVIGAGNTVTSAAFPFTSAETRNHIRITGGVGFTTGVYEITNVVGVVATLDRSPGTLASTGGTGNLGGALATLTGANAITVAGATVWVRNGAYTTAATITLNVDSDDGLPVSYLGYGTVRGDNEQAVLTCTNAAATTVLDLFGRRNMIRNLTVDGASLGANCFRFSDNGIVADNCHALNATQRGFSIPIGGTYAYLRRCTATACGTTTVHGGFVAASETAMFDRCVSYDNGGNGFVVISAEMRCNNCIARGNTLSGFLSSGPISYMKLLDCTSRANTLDGARWEGVSAWEATAVRNCIFASNAGYGMRAITTDYSGVTGWIFNLENNAFYNNALGARFQVPTGADDIILTVDPFTDAANNDLALNMLEGGGLELRATGVPGGFGLRSSPDPSVGFNDIGAVPASGATSASTPLGTMRSLWRELTGEKDVVVVPDTIVDMYLQRGLEWLNQALEYHLATDDAGVTLVAGQQEYDLDADVVRIKWVFLGGQEVARGDIEEWRNNGENWRNEDPGFPLFWSVEGQRLILRPKPNAAAAALTPDIRYVSNPPDIGVAGPEQLPAQDWRIAVFHGVALWSIAYPDSALAIQRAEGYLSRAREEALFSQRDASAKETVK